MHCTASHPGSPSPYHAIAIFNLYLDISTLQQKSSIGPLLLVPQCSLFPLLNVFSLICHHRHKSSSRYGICFTIYTLIHSCTVFSIYSPPFRHWNFFFFLFLYYSTCIFPFSLLFSALFLSLGSVWSGSVCMGPRFFSGLGL